MSKVSHTDANIRKEYEKPENFKKIRDRYEPITERDKTDKSELVQMFEKLLRKRPDEESDDTSNGEADTDTAKLDKSKKSTKDTKSHENSTKKNKGAKSAFTEELKKAVAKKASKNSDDIMNGQKKSRHEHTTVNKKASDKRSDKVQEDTVRPEPVAENIESNKSELSPELARAFAKRKIFENEKRMNEETEEHVTGISDNECRLRRSSSLKTGRNRIYQSEQFPGINAVGDKETTTRRISPLKRTKSVNDVQPNRKANFQSRKIPDQEDTKKWKADDEAKDISEETDDNDSPSIKSKSDAKEEIRKEKVEQKQLEQKKLKEEKKLKKEPNEQNFMQRKSNSVAKEIDEETESIQSDGNASPRIKSEINGKEEKGKEKDEDEQLEEKKQNKVKKFKKEQSKVDEEAKNIEEETKSIQSESKKSSKSQKSKNDAKEEKEKEKVLQKQLKKKKETKDKKFKKERSEKEQEDTRTAEPITGNIESYKIGLSPELARAFAKRASLNCEDLMNEQTNEQTNEQSVQHSYQTEGHVIDESDKNVMSALTNSVKCDFSDHQTVSEIGEVSGKRTYPIDPNTNNLVDAGSKSDNDYSTNGQTSSPNGHTTERKVGVISNNSAKTNRSQTQPTLSPRPADQLQSLEDDILDVESGDESDTLEDACSTDYPIESGVDVQSSSAAGSIEVSRIEYMIEVFMPYIKHQIKVTDVIDHLHLSEREKDIILSKHAFCASDAVELLISMLKKSEFKGKWQAFRYALDMKDFEYIKLLIDGKTEMNHDSNRQLLKLVTPELVKRLDAQNFLDITFEKELLTEEDKCHVQAQLREHGEYAAIRVIMGKIDKHRTDWNATLIEIFEQEKFCLGDIADLFRLIKNQEPDLPVKGTKVRSKVKRSKSNEEMAWRLKYLQGLDHVASNLSTIGYTEDPNKPPTSEDIRNLTLEIRQLRETIEKQTQRR